MDDPVAFAQLGKKEWSIMRLVDDTAGYVWWCGHDGWVSSRSDYWQLSGCNNVIFKSLQNAKVFADSQGWMKAEK